MERTPTTIGEVTMPTKPKIAPRYIDLQMPVQNPIPTPQLILECLEADQKVVQMPIDNTPTQELNAIIEYQRLLGRSWELELGEGK